MDLLQKRIGNIRVEEMLGTGGMGKVYRGFDVRLERHVAIKTLRAHHWLDGEVKARFLREARILSRLESSSICQVYDLLEEDEADYLIFEYVEGKTLRQIIDGQELDWVQVLTIAEKIAGALAVAHGEGIVHRDLKPENVMVTPGGEVKILDFGISYAVRDHPLKVGEESGEHVPDEESGELSRRVKETEPSEDSKHLTLAATVLRSISRTGGGQGDSIDLDASLHARLTEHGTLIGTLNYMSPEQATGDIVTQASDLFSLGLLLQEMLTGEPAREPGPLGIFLERIAGGETRSPHGFGLDPDVAHLVEDLVRLEPERRPSAAATASRLRWIVDRPNRIKRRQRKNLLAAAAFATLLIILAVVSWQSIRSERWARRAKNEAQRAEAEANQARKHEKRAHQEINRAHEVVEFLVELFEAASPEQTLGENLSVKDILKRGSERIDRELQAQPLVRARLKDTLGTIHWKLGDYRESERLLRAALEIRRKNLPGTSPERARSKRHLAGLYADQGRLDLAEPLLRAATTILSQHQPEEESVLALVLNDLAALLFEKREFGDAKTMYEEALELAEHAHGERSIKVAQYLNNLAALSWEMEEPAEAKALLEQAFAIQQEKQLGENHPHRAAVLNNLGILYQGSKDWEAAEKFHLDAVGIAERVLGQSHPNVALMLDSLAHLRASRERLQEAGALLERALAIRIEKFGPDSPQAAHTLVGLGDLLRRRGQTERAEEMLTRAGRLLRNSKGRDHPWTLRSVHLLANLHRDLGENITAAALDQQVQTAAKKTLGADDLKTFDVERLSMALLR